MPNILREKSGIPANPIGNTLISLSKASASFGKCFAGLTHHPVFMDAHFDNYTHIIAISYIASNGEETWLPIIDKTGSPDYYVYGQNWVKWSFRINSGIKINYKLFERGVEQFTAFWAHKNGVKTKNASFKVYFKKIDTPNGFEYGFLEKQRAKKWEEMGSILWRDDAYQLNIQEQYNDLFKQKK